MDLEISGETPEPNQHQDEIQTETNKLLSPMASFKSMIFF
jgi:hypothetical protein